MNNSVGEIVFISGWAEEENVFDCYFKDIKIKKFAPCFIPLESAPEGKFSLPSLFAEHIAKKISSNSTIIGWSLGGMIAQEIAAFYPELVAKLILINSTSCFVQSKNNPHGVARNIVRSMKLGLKNNFHKTLSDFFQLSYGVIDEQKILKKIEHLQTVPLGNLSYGLDYLQHVDLSGFKYDSNLEILLLNSEDDKVISPKSALNFFKFSSKIKNKTLAVKRHAFSHCDINREDFLGHLGL